ncbi:hypothetical protein NM688_g6845 [Phlebia brevispora]|uniref:Uncharacterized protein n=1 Tax=Phlebia brevispora TaxID=194682 RepID=A0ACC1SC61_9APHY|nr:hypothetical protein NM688_g6845 [Phlebia brevispora]
MAPETLKKEKQAKKVKKEEKKLDLKGKAPAKPDEMEIDEEAPGKVNLANAVHLSDSEEEEEMEDIIDDFELAMNMDTETDIRQERLYFFQFPNPLPKFLSNAASQQPPTASQSEDSSSKVSGEDAKPQAAATPLNAEVKAEPEAAAQVDGIVGQLEIYRSGAVKMRLGNDIVLDVTAATQPSFLQHAVYVDPDHKRISVLGEVNRRFVVSPDIDSLLTSLEHEEQQARGADLDTAGLIQMDTT